MSKLSELEFAINKEPRCPCILLLDTSYSMQGKRISSLNDGLRAFQESLMQDDLAQLRVDVAILSFSGTAKVVQDFVNASNFEPPRLDVEQGGTAMGAGVTKAIAMVNERKQSYKSEGIDYYRPWIFMITDGEPTDDISSAAEMVKSGETNKNFLFLSVGVEDADLQILSQLSKRSPVMLKGTNFREMFSWLSASMSRVSQSRTDETVKLPSIDGWAEV